jgi:hypothetical protein
MWIGSEAEADREEIVSERMASKKGHKSSRKRRSTYRASGKERLVSRREI